ncbi:Inositolphosphorylceramide synthase subunit Kei1-domain-containing protein [Amylocarpus encephaloides]|uniref:Inositolphosphorylceramide synthase subunit Kei1-domain-containing protein n=1 Tax=Amylocarpus encephaloides TaxID=45428 RepID=A0A9P7Y8B4_9HELO|nr:Inositolphosphorylceramide synthase subunit Kei1-domain-containing protein [Amylocarpus encephaloides]
MSLLPRWLRPQIPRPRTFIYFMSLRTGVEMIALSMLFNKVAGFFGLLAVLTGFRLSPLQFSMYIYSVAALVLLAFLAPHIRKQSPFQCLALAWLYLLDTVINTAFTSAFAVTWFLAVSANKSGSPVPGSAPGSGTIDDTAGFTSPIYNASGVNIVVTPGKGVAGGQDAVAVGAGSISATGSTPTIGQGVGVEESIPSLMLVFMFTLIRMYFILIVMAYARQVLRQHVYSSSSTKLHLHTDSNAESSADNPFAVGSPEGEGWRGKLGRVMVKVGESYWLGGQADEAWAKGVDGRFKATKTPSGPPGTIERERRARSGTGPPVPQNLGMTQG